MGAYTSVTVLNSNVSLGGKTVTVTAVGPASYDAGGSALDVSIATLGPAAGLTRCDGVKLMAMDAAAGAIYNAWQVPGASAGVPKVMLRDVTQAADAQASGDLSARTFTFECSGI